MSVVRRSVDVPAPLDDVVEAWEHFLDGVLTGKRRLACDEIACVNAIEIGVVGFEESESGGTRVTFKATLPDDLFDDDRLNAEREVLESKVARDLVLFWDYIESDDYRRERATQETVLAQHEDELRRTHARRQKVVSDQDSISVRRSARS